jgi:hypothetical protein
MSSRGASVDVLAEIAASSNKPFHLFEVRLSGGTTYATDAFKNVIWNGNTYYALGTLVTFSGVEETVDLNVTTASVTLSGVDQTMVANLLTYKYIDRQLIIYKAFFNASDSVIVNPISIFNGRCDSPSIMENPDDGTCSITLTASAHFIDFERRPGRHTNHAEQQLWFPGDKGFEYVSQLNKQIMWGSTPKNASSGGSSLVPRGYSGDQK